MFETGGEAKGVKEMKNKKQTPSAEKKKTEQTLFQVFVLSLDNHQHPVVQTRGQTRLFR